MRMMGSWISKGQERAHNHQGQGGHSYCNRWKVRMAGEADLQGYLEMANMVIMVSPGVRQVGRVFNTQNLKRANMNEHEADISFIKGKWQFLTQFPDLRQLSKPEPTEREAAWTLRWSLQDLQSLYGSDSSSLSLKGSLAISLGNQKMQKEEYLDISRALDIGSELTEIPRDSASIKGRTNGSKIISGVLAQICLTVYQLCLWTSLVIISLVPKHEFIDISSSWQYHHIGFLTCGGRVIVVGKAKWKFLEICSILTKAVNQKIVINQG